MSWWTTCRPGAHLQKSNWSSAQRVAANLHWQLSSPECWTSAAFPHQLLFNRNGFWVKILQPSSKAYFNRTVDNGLLFPTLGRLSQTHLGGCWTEITYVECRYPRKAELSELLSPHQTSQIEENQCQHRRIPRSGSYGSCYYKCPSHFWPLAPPSSSINGAIVVLKVNETIFPSAAVGDRWWFKGKIAGWRGWLSPSTRRGVNELQTQARASMEASRATVVYTKVVKSAELIIVRTCQNITLSAHMKIMKLKSFDPSMMSYQVAFPPPSDSEIHSMPLPGSRNGQKSWPWIKWPSLARSNSRKWHAIVGSCQLLG